MNSKSHSVFVYFDVSGSIPETCFLRYLLEAEKRKHSIDHDEWKMFCFDTKVSSYEEYKKNPVRQGGGGTAIQAVEEHFLTHANPGDTLILFSDGFIPIMKQMPWAPTKGLHEFVFFTEYPESCSDWKAISHSRLTIVGNNDA